MEKKTIEEKLNASRVYLDTVCNPTYTIKHGIIARKANTTYSIQVRRKDGFADYFVIPQIGQAESEIVEMFYLLLGLAERDAVAECDNRGGCIIEMSQERARLDSENKAMKAEIKRLREFAQQCFKSPEKLAVIHYFENGEFDYCDLVPLQDAAINSLSPAPVAEDKFSASAYPKKCTPTIDQLTESDDMTMVQRLEKRIPPFHKVAHVTEPPSGILQTILALPDDTSAAYIKSMIHDHTTGQ